MQLSSFICFLPVLEPIMGQADFVPVRNICTIKLTCMYTLHALQPLLMLALLQLAFKHSSCWTPDCSSFCSCNGI